MGSTLSIDEINKQINDKINEVKNKVNDETNNIIFFAKIINNNFHFTTFNIIFRNW